MDRGPEKNSTNFFPVRTEQASSITSIYSIHSIYGELVEGKLPVGRPKLRYKDVCKKDMKFSGLDTGIWAEHSWLGNNTSGVAAEEKRAKRKAACKFSTTLYEAQFTCQNCGSVCKSNIGLLSHDKRCCISKNF